MIRRIAQWTLMLLLAGSLLGCAAPTYRQRLQSEDPMQRISGAIAAARARDRAAAVLLIDRLEDDDEAVRMYAILALQRIQGTTLGYKYWADPAERARMAQRWRDHLKTRSRLSPQQQPDPEPSKTQADLPDPQARPMERTPSSQPLAQEASR